jgi:ABC-type Fe3+-citrate transport system substrate-binding protein
MTAQNQFPVVRPSQRVRNVARAMTLSSGRSEGAYPTNADTLEEIAAAVAQNEEAQAQQAARIAELETALAETADELELFTSMHYGVVRDARKVLNGGAS